jgi:uncharacterized protein
MAHPNEELVRRDYDAFAREDMDTLRELFDPGIIWHFPGRSPLAGDHRGTDAVLGFFGRTMELTAGTFRAELHDVLADDRHTVGMHQVTGEREGRTLEDREVLVFTSATARLSRCGSTSRTSTPTMSSSPRRC